MEQDLLKYFIKRSDERFDKIEKKLDNLNNWKMKIIGGAVVAYFIVSFIFQLFVKQGG